MSGLERFREAIVRGDFASAQALLMEFGESPTANEPGEIRDALVWALQLIRIQRAHDAARLGELIRSSAYRPHAAGSGSTWTLNA